MKYQKLAREIDLYVKKSAEFVTQPLVAYTQKFLANMFSYNKGIDYRITSLASDDSHRIVLDFFSAEHPATEPQRREAIRGAVQNELNNKFPDVDCKVQVVFPLKAVKGPPRPFFRFE